MPEPAVSEFAALEATLEVQRQRVEAALRRCTDAAGAPGVADAAEDSLFAPAKRLRPILSLLVAEVLRGDPASVLPAACAIEMVHTASLILDDLPVRFPKRSVSREAEPGITHGLGALIKSHAERGRQI